MGRACTATALGAWLIAFCPMLEACARAQSTERPGQVDRNIRAIDEARRLLDEGLEQSATLKALAADIEQSDVIVMVVTSKEPGAWRGDTRFLSAGGGRRILAVKVNQALDLRDRLAVLGHEFQHVLEVAAAPNVVDNTTMRRHFSSLGVATSPNGDRYETVAAQAVERRVTEELARRRRA